MKIVPIGVDDHRLSDDLIHPKSPGQNRHFRLPLTRQQWRQVTSMVRMRITGWIIMGTGPIKVFPFAIVSLVNVKSVKSIPGQTGHFH